MSDGPTGDSTVDAALAPLAQLEHRPLTDHPDVLDGIHRTLHDHLVNEPANETYLRP